LTPEEQIEHLLDTHPRPLSLAEREALRPNMHQILLLLAELNIDLETWESQLVTTDLSHLRYN
jgi:hypothetical protein